MRRLLMGAVAAGAVAITAGPCLAAYGFTFTSEDTVEASPVGEMAYMYATLTNTGDDHDTLAVWGELTDIPGDWVAQFCDTVACYIILPPPNIVIREYPMDPGISLPFEIKILPMSEGQGMITLFARSQGDTTLVAGIQFRVGSPLDVELTSLDIVPGQGLVSLGWRTEGTALAGFRLHRSESGASYECITPGLLTPDATGSASYTDAGLRNGTRYSYLIEAVSISGSSEHLGPFSAVPGRSLSWGVLKASYR